MRSTLLHSTSIFQTLVMIQRICCATILFCVKLVVLTIVASTSISYSEACVKEKQRLAAATTVVEWYTLLKCWKKKHGYV